MTREQQRRLYFPAWNKACKALAWRMARGRLEAQRLACFVSPALDAVYQRIWTAAENRAMVGHRAVTLNDLRHGCHIAALGRDISSQDMTNDQTDRSTTLFRLLADPKNLELLIAWQDPKAGTVQRYVSAIRRLAPQTYIDEVCSGKFNRIYRPPFWEQLPPWALRQLLVTLRNRKPDPEDKTIDCPF